MNGRSTDVIAIPDHPTKGHAAVGFAARPAASVHHRQAAAKNVDPREAAAFEDRSAAFGFQESQSRQYDHQRGEFESVGNELLDDFEGWIYHNGFAAVGHLAFHQEVATPEAVGAAVIDEVGSDDLVARRTQRVENPGAVAAARLPQPVRQPLMP